MTLDELERARCSTMDPELFFPDPVCVCRICPRRGRHGCEGCKERECARSKKDISQWADTPKREQAEAAKDQCRLCPVLEACAADLWRYGPAIFHGVRAATDEDERRLIRKQADVYFTGIGVPHGNLQLAADLTVLRARAPRGQRVPRNLMARALQGELEVAV